MDRDSIVVTPFPTLARDVDIQVPSAPDKSMTHRAIMLAAMAKGRSEITNPLDGDDCQATRRVFQNLGVSFSESKSPSGDVTWLVESPGMNHWQSPAAEQDLGNSGTSARLLTGLFAGIPGLTITLTGDESLRSRPMSRVVEPLRSMGAQIGGPNGGATLKLTITGSLLNPATHTLQTASAQMKSALLLAGLSAQGQTRMDLPEGGRDHTEHMLRALGAVLHVSKKLGREQISVVGPWQPPSFSCQIPSDPSSVAFFAGLAALHPGLRVTAQNVIRNRTRIGFYEVLGRMGVDVAWGAAQDSARYLGEAVSSLTISRFPGVTLKSVHVTRDQVASMIDEVPILSVLCAFADGTSTIDGLEELRVKESDRLTAIGELLSDAGVKSWATDGSIEIRGQSTVNAFSYSSNDHRMVMSSMILATKANGPSQISGLSWIRTSFPLFIEAFQNIKLMNQ